MTRRLILLGGGSIREKTTLPIDSIIADYAKAHAGENRAYALFFPTASHDSKPYFNSFRKTYTSEFDIKADVALLTRNEMTVDKIAEKIAKADLIYIGGGDTPYMVELFRKEGILDLLLSAYNSGVVFAGLSAGAIFWFEKMFTDTEIMNGLSEAYASYDGISLLKGIACPHYDERPEFDQEMQSYSLGYAIENNCALLFENETLKGKLTAGGTAYLFRKVNGIIVKEEIK